MRLEAKVVDDFFRERFRQLFTQDRERHLVARNQNVSDVLIPDESVEGVNDFLGVLEMEVLDVPLIPRLRPSALRSPSRLDVLHFAIGHQFACRDDEDVCGICIGHQRRISRRLRFKSSERIEVGSITDVKSVLWNDTGRLNRLE